MQIVIVTSVVIAVTWHKEKWSDQYSNPGPPAVESNDINIIC